MSHNTWNDPRIVGHTEIGEVVHHDVQAAAEHLHRNESLHRHDPSGRVCVYCALSAVRVARTLGVPVVPGEGRP